MTEALQVDASVHGESHHVEDIKKHVRVYVMVFVALAVLTIVTVAVGYLRLPIMPALIVALLIAAVKGGLVASYFMHLISERKVVYALLALTVGLLLFMFLLFTSVDLDQDGGATGAVGRSGGAMPSSVVTNVQAPLAATTQRTTARLAIRRYAAPDAALRNA